MLNVGIIGTGSISRAHLTGYGEFPDEARVVALTDIVPERAEDKRRQFGLDDARTYSSAAAMLAAEDLDLVSIATPPSTHCELTVAALETGVGVLVEKPMAPSLEECDRMLAAQRSSGALLSVVAQNRFRDDMARLKAVLDAGAIGPVSHARIASEWWRGLSYYDLSWRGTWESEGGGCTLNHAIHHLDLTLWLLGAPQAVTAMMTNAQHDNAEVEDLSVAILQYERSLAELTSSVVSHGEEQQIVLQGARARVSQPWRTVAESAQPNGFPTPDGDRGAVAEIDALVADLPPLEHTRHAGQIGDVLAALRARRAGSSDDRSSDDRSSETGSSDAGSPTAGPAISGEDGRRSIELVTAIYAAAIERRVVDLPIAADDPWYRAGTLVERAPHFFEKTASVDEQEGRITVDPSRRDG